MRNERGELTDTCAGNVVLELDGRKLTPHASSGPARHLPRGAARRGEIAEEVLPVKTLERASRLFFVNSVRRWCEIVLA